MSALGHTRFGRYRVVRELGRGAMGVVYEAEDESLQRPVAIKTMLLGDDEAEQREYEARFRQEAKAAAGLNHASVVTVYDMGREGEWLYIAMELLDGVELRTLIREGSLTVPQTVSILAQVASGLAAAHRRGIIHRDMKPANIMVLAGNRAKIMDFGVARVQSSEVKTRTGVMLGSPRYMSPEQVEGRPIDHRSDIFSLGTILYEALTGSAPFQGQDLGSLLFSIARAEPPPASQRNPAVPPALDGIIARCLHKNMQERYQDADDLAHDLAQCIALADGSSRPMPLELVPAADPQAPTQAIRTASAAAGTNAGPATVHGAAGTAFGASGMPGAMADADDDRTVVQSRFAPPAAPAPSPAPPVDHAATATGTSSRPAPAAGMPVSPHFDSPPGLRRLDQLATGAAMLHARTPTGDRGRWAWPLAYAVAAVLALALAFT